ncbi:MAG: hypothetical protein ACOYOV_12680 [Bacteroidales bacterium]
MNRIIFIALVFILFSCGKKIKGKNESSYNNDCTKTNIKTSDTLRDPYSFYYLADIKPKQFVELVLSDSIFPSDNYSTFRIMDSLDAVSFEDRKYYFNVFLHIMKKADGSLAEAIGDPARAYTMNHTKEFFNFANSLKPEEFESFANYVGSEFAVEVSAENLKKRTENYYKILKTNCKECTLKEKRNLEKYFRKVKQAIENDKCY